MITKMLSDLEKSSQYIGIMSLEDLKGSMLIFNKNFDELLNYIDFINEKFEDVKNKDLFTQEERNSFSNELFRLFHNFVASAYTMLNLSNMIFKKYHMQDEPKFYGEFKKKRSELRREPIFEIIYYLRQYIQHVNISKIEIGYIPDIQFREKLVVKWDKMMVQIYKDDLMKYNELRKNKIIIKYLTTVKDFIDLKVILQKYEKILEEFYKWIFSRIDKNYKCDIDYVTIEVEKIRIKQLPQTLEHYLEFFKSGLLKKPDLDLLAVVLNKKVEEINEIYPSKELRHKAFLKAIKNVGVKDDILAQIDKVFFG